MRTKRIWVSNPRLTTTRQVRKPVSKPQPKLVILNHVIGIKGMNRNYAKQTIADYIANYKHEEKIEGYILVQYFTLHDESEAVRIELVYSDTKDITPILDKIADKNNVIDGKQLKRFLTIHDVVNQK